MQKCLVQLELDVDLGGHLVGEQAAVVVGDDDLADLEGGGGREGEEEEDGEGEGGRHCGRMFFHKYRVGVGMCVQESELCSTVPHCYVWTQCAFGERCEVRPNMGGARPASRQRKKFLSLVRFA